MGEKDPINDNFTFDKQDGNKMNNIKPKDPELDQVIANTQKSCAVFPEQVKNHISTFNGKNIKGFEIFAKAFNEAKEGNTSRLIEKLDLNCLNPAKTQAAMAGLRSQGIAMLEGSVELATKIKTAEIEAQKQAAKDAQDAANSAKVRENMIRVGGALSALTGGAFKTVGR